MKKSSLILLLLSFTVLIIAQQKPVVRTQPIKTAEPQAVSSGKFTGTMFNDMLYVIQEPQTGNPAAKWLGRNEFVLRRATLGYDYTYNKDISARVVYDGSANVLKQGYAEVKNITSLVDLKLGLTQTLSSEIVEKIWDYRSLEATTLDRQGMTNEFDKGLTITGRTNAQGTSYARLAIYNGSGLGAENDKLKKLALAIGNWFDKYSVVELYVDYENVGAGRSTITAKVFYGMTAMKFTFGGEGFYRMNRKFAGTKDITPVGASVFGWYELMKSLRAVVRVDATDDNLDVSTTGYREVYFNGGIDYSPIPEVRLIPNLVFVKNLKKGTGVEIADYMMLRLTTAVYFK